MLLYGREYARKIVENARLLASLLYKGGLNISYPEKRFTSTHQVHLKVRDEEEGRKIVEMLEGAGVIVDIAVCSGLQEITRRGISERDLRRIAEIICNILMNSEKPTKYRDETRGIAKKLNRVAFSFDV